MTTFSEALDYVLEHEGGHSNDPDDPGGETYRGISRVYHPAWVGWSLLDTGETDGLEQAVAAFYAEHFWNRFQGAPVSAISGLVALELLDSAVNLGVTRAVRFLQIALSVLNRGGKLYPDLVDDGLVGPKTLRALSTLVKGGEEALVLKVMNVLQGAYYVERMQLSERQEKYARGWFDRVVIEVAA